MDTYHEIKMQVKTQLKGHFLFLYGWLLFVSLLIALIQNVGGFLGNGLGATLLSLALSLLCVVVNNTMLFLFIQRVRSLRFRKQDIRYSFSKAGEQIVIGLCLSLLQLFLQIAVSVCAFLPILYMLVSAFLSLFFVYWYACIAWLIYDQDTHIKDLFIKPLHIMKVRLILGRWFLCAVEYPIANWFKHGIKAIYQGERFLRTGFVNTCSARGRSYGNDLAVISILYCVFLSTICNTCRAVYLFSKCI